MKRGALRHVLALGVWAGATSWWLWPILSSLTHAIPGRGPGDNLTFVWNIWWMRQAVQHSTYAFFRSPLIFYPEGVNLTLHTHTALPALLAALAAPTADLLATQNILIATNLLLNGVAAYALAFYLTRHVGGALLAAIVFGWSPYLAGHVQGHFNLVAAWPLPVVTLLTLHALSSGAREADALATSPSASPAAYVPPRSASATHAGARRGLIRAAAIGAALAATAYMDYYYAVYGVLAVLVLAAGHGIRLRRRDSRPVHRLVNRACRVLLVLIVAATGIAIAIAVTGGGVMAIGPIRASLTGVDNPLGAAWLLSGIVILLKTLPRLALQVDRSRVGAGARVGAIAIGVAFVGVAPLLAGLFDLWWHGDYITQRYLWRSAPRGIDLATLLLGNPFGLVTGTFGTAQYARFGIDAIEQAAWIGPGVIALCAVAITDRREDRDLRLLLYLGAVFLTWAVGPYLAVFGHSTAMVLPVTALRYVPVISNARIPGRAIVMVYMVAAVLCAHAVACLLGSADRRKRWTAVLLAVLVVVDYAPGAVVHYFPARPRVYEALPPLSSPGALLELPVGLRDGFGEAGTFDSSVLYYQSLHGRAIAGGFIARLPPSVTRAYETNAVLARLLRLSSGGSLSADDRDDGSDAADLIRQGFRYVVLDREAAPAGLTAYVTRLPLRMLSDDGSRAVYELLASQ
jgi:hypothetical protein